MKICPNCGSEFGDDLNFCQKDGTPLVSSAEPTDQDEPIGDKTQAIDSAPPVGEETLVMPEPPDIGDATLAMDSEEIQTFVRGEEESDPMEDTRRGPDEAPPAVVGGQDIPSVPDDTMYSSDESFSSTAGSVDADEGWEEESFEGTENWGEPESGGADEWEEDDESEGEWDEQPFAEEIAASEQVAEEEKKGSGARIGLIIAGLIVVFGFLFVVAAAVAIWWYTSSRGDGPILTAANTEENSNLNSEDPFGDPYDENTNAGEDLNPGDVDSNTADRNSNTAATPDPKNTPRDATPTPTPGATRTPVRDTRPSPTPARTATPRPTSTLARSTPPPPSRISKGVVNGAAISLPKPAYPAAARAVNAKGQVNVAVVISETGRVISASATSGHPLLRSAAVSAARRARFRPTLLNGRPVEVSGVIVYNFQ